MAAFLYVRMYHQRVVIPEALASYPTVLVDGSCADTRIPSVVPDEFGGGAAAAREFLEHGRTRIAFINNVDDIPASRDRLAGFRVRAARAGLKPAPERMSWRRCRIPPVGYRAAATTAGSAGAVRRRSSASTTGSPWGSTRPPIRRGLNIPADLSVIGFDNQYGIADGLFPGLTTLALPHYDMGAWGVQTLVSQVEDREATPTQVQLPCPLVRRESVAFARAMPSEPCMASNISALTGQGR